MERGRLRGDAERCGRRGDQQADRDGGMVWEERRSAGGHGWRNAVGGEISRGTGMAEWCGRRGDQQADRDEFCRLGDGALMAFIQ